MQVAGKGDAMHSNRMGKEARAPLFGSVCVLWSERRSLQAKHSRRSRSSHWSSGGLHSLGPAEALRRDAARRSGGSGCSGPPPPEPLARACLKAYGGAWIVTPASISPGPFYSVNGVIAGCSMATTFVRIYIIPVFDSMQIPRSRFRSTSTLTTMAFRRSVAN